MNPNENLSPGGGLQPAAPPDQPSGTQTPPVQPAEPVRPQPAVNAPQPYKVSLAGKRLLGMIEFDNGEELICEIRKHPVGLFVIYMGGLLISSTIMIIAALAVHYLPTALATDGTNFSTLQPILLLVALLSVGIVAILTFISARIYQNNMLLVTNQKIAQVIYRTIINRKISQLSLGKIEDVTVWQNNLLARMFNFGTIVIETAGEQDNYVFTYAPNPYQCSKEIVGAHEMDVARHGN